MTGCRPLTNKEIEKVISKLNEGLQAKRNIALFVLGVTSGFRIQEMLALKVKDVFKNGKITDFVSVSRQHMKKKLEGRTVKINNDGKEALLSYITENELCPNSFLFPSRKDPSRAIDRIQAWRILKNVFDSVGMTGKLGTHSLRKTFAKNMHKFLDNDIVQTQSALGHRNIASTLHYLSVNQENVDKAIDKNTPCKKILSALKNK